MIEGKIRRFDRVVFGGRERWRVASSFRHPQGGRVFVLERWFPHKRRFTWECVVEWVLREFYKRDGRSPRRKR